MNNAESTSSLCTFAIRSKNHEIIRQLEDNHVDPTGARNIKSFNKKDKADNYAECFKELIKCHHKEIANYINTKKI